MTMTSVDLIVDFEDPLRFSKSVKKDCHRMAVNLVWIKRNALTEAFDLDRVEDGSGLELLEKDISLQEFLSFHGSTFDDAVGKNADLKFRADWRLEHGGEGYLEVSEIENFYKEVSGGNRPVSLVIQFVEHY